MKAQGNWKAYEKNGVKRIYVSEIAYFERGDSGLMSQVNFNQKEIDFACRVFSETEFGADFDKWFNSIKENKAEKKAKKVSINDFAMLYAAHISAGMSAKESATLAKAGK